MPREPISRRSSSLMRTQDVPPTDPIILPISKEGPPVSYGAAGTSAARHTRRPAGISLDLRTESPREDDRFLDTLCSQRTRVFRERRGNAQTPLPPLKDVPSGWHTLPVHRRPFNSTNNKKISHYVTTISLSHRSP